MTALPAGSTGENTVDTAVLQAVDRAVADLRRGATVLLAGPHGTAGLIQAAETAGPEGPARLGEVAGSAPLLLITAQRAASLGIAAGPR